MSDEIITYEDYETQAALNISAADSPGEFQRWRIRARLQHQNGQYQGEASYLHLYAWPDLAVCVAGELTFQGTTYHLDRGHPLPFELYLELPDALIVEIEEVLYRLNPQWVVRADTADSQKKEVTNSTGA